MFVSLPAGAADRTQVWDVRLSVSTSSSFQPTVCVSQLPESLGCSSSQIHSPVTSPWKVSTQMLLGATWALEGQGVGGSALGKVSLSKSSDTNNHPGPPAARKRPTRSTLLSSCSDRDALSLRNVSFDLFSRGTLRVYVPCSAEASHPFGCREKAVVSLRGLGRWELRLNQWRPGPPTSPQSRVTGAAVPSTPGGFSVLYTWAQS